jgi:hypothetical protein
MKLTPGDRSVAVVTFKKKKKSKISFKTNAQVISCEGEGGGHCKKVRAPSQGYFDAELEKNLSDKLDCFLVKLTKLTFHCVLVSISPIFYEQLFVQKFFPQL